jgi:hypothetical protein
MAREMGMSLGELERRAAVMARVTDELGPELGQLKLETYGIDLNQHDRLALASVQHAVDEAHAAVVRARAVLRALAESEVLPVQIPRIIVDAMPSLATALGMVGGLRPVALCPVCKRIPIVRAECGTCLTSGYVDKWGAGRIDPRLTDQKYPVVRYRGQLIPVEKINQ